LREYLKHSGAEGKIYVIINGKLVNPPKEVNLKIFDIAASSFQMLITTQGAMDLYRFKSAAEKEGLSFNFRHIPNDYNEDRKSEFDSAYMKKLFDLGYKIGASQNPWQKELEY
jgi:hypothetical protein